MAVRLCRGLFDLDADPSVINGVLGSDPALAPLIASSPGTRLPVDVSAFEVAVRAIVGQQVSVAGARTTLTRLVSRLGRRVELATATGLGLDRLFPTPAALAEADPTSLGMPASRGRTPVGLGRAVAGGDLVLDRNADREQTRQRLLELRGIGPGPAGYIAMRGLGDPDVLLPGDVVVRRMLAAVGLDRSDRAAADHAERWRPWRSYVVMHLWRLAAAGVDTRTTGQAR